jgi:hypothetical protein
VEKKMISKRALVFGYPGIPGTEDYCEGVLRDIDNYYAYLSSNHGGAWNSETVGNSDAELYKKLNITKKQLITYINYFNTISDYSVLIFAGHGRYDDKYGQILRVNPHEDIALADLRLTTSRQLLIMDCCRKRGREPLLESLNSERMRLESFANTRWLYRDRYDKQLQGSIKGTIELYACSINEYANDCNLGGYFSYQLLKQAQGRHDKSIFQDFNDAKPEVQRMSRQLQNPVIAKPRMEGNTFPFYIS